MCLVLVGGEEERGVAGTGGTVDLVMSMIVLLNILTINIFTGSGANITRGNAVTLSFSGTSCDTNSAIEIAMGLAASCCTTAISIPIRCSDDTIGFMDNAATSALFNTNSTAGAIMGSTTTNNGACICINMLPRTTNKTITRGTGNIMLSALAFATSGTVSSATTTFNILGSRGAVAGLNNGLCMNSCGASSMTSAICAANRGLAFPMVGTTTTTSPRLVLARRNGNTIVEGSLYASSNSCTNYMFNVSALGNRGVGSCIAAGTNSVRMITGSRNGVAAKTAVLLGSSDNGMITACMFVCFNSMGNSNLISKASTNGVRTRST